MKKTTYFDVEFANNKNKSICQIGIMCEDYEDGEPYYPELNLYVNPEDGFDDNCIMIHGITKAKVENEPTFVELWKTLEKYFTNTVVIGHNVKSSDLNALVKSLRRYNIDIPEMYYICTYELAKKYVPRFEVSNYSLSCLCNYFGIDIDNEHDAFDDACACSDLFKALVDKYGIDVDDCVEKYEIKETEEFSVFAANPVIRKAISEFYGIVCGITIDEKVNDLELQYIKNWKKDNAQYNSVYEIGVILSVLDDILEDGVITIDEMNQLQNVVEYFLDSVSTSLITLATQVLDGILKGIAADGSVTEDECKGLRVWLYENNYLEHHYPFDKVLKIINDILEDGTITEEESDYLLSVIDDLLNPVESLKSNVNSVNGKHVCLSGNFAYGKKVEVEKYIVERGGNIDKSVKKSTNILIIGEYESQSYSNGTYGTKVKKAIELNDKGCNISIVKEKDFFSIMG